MPLRRTLTSFILFVSAVIYFSCDDAGVIVKDETFCISGQITNWTLGTKTLHAYVRNKSGASFSAANCPVDASGNFNLCLPETITETALYTSDSIFFIGCDSGNVVFNPPNVKGTEISSFRVKSGDSTVANIRRNNYDTLYPGAFSVMYIYTNIDVTVTGNEYCNWDTLTFNGSATAPWTKVVKHCTRVLGPGTSYTYDTDEPPGAVWEWY
jgi:hypothetical protein